MKLVCAPEGYLFPSSGDALSVILFGSAVDAEYGSVGGAIPGQFARENFSAANRAWDFLSLALSVAAADLAGHRGRSPDGWTREFEIEVAVASPDSWNSLQKEIETVLGFLTTDIWRVRFTSGGFHPKPARSPVLPNEDCMVLLSGGLDSLIGAIDLAANGRKPFAVSHLVRGDAKKQLEFAQRIGGGLRHLQMNHNASVPDAEEPPTQRARSLAFLAYGVLAATTLSRYRDGETVPLYICENGFVAINPALTGARLGSLSTRTTHPFFLGSLQRVLNAVGLRIAIENPYALRTKGEMMVGCRDQTLLAELASQSTSCGRFLKYSYRHCGRCVPCQVRRAAFLRWGEPDLTSYVFEDLGKEDEEHSAFDDVRACSIAIAEAASVTMDRWLGNALIGASHTERSALIEMLRRGLQELSVLHQKYGVK